MDLLNNFFFQFNYFDWEINIRNISQFEFSAKVAAQNYFDQIEQLFSQFLNDQRSLVLLIPHMIHPHGDCPSL